MPYEVEPRYPAGAPIATGYGPLVAATLLRPAVIAIDGPAAVDWPRVVSRLSETVRHAGATFEAVDVRTSMASWSRIQELTERPDLRSDPVFARVFDRPIDDLFGTTSPELPRGADITLVFGPGSALVQHDVLWYADLPKRIALTAVEARRASNVGQPPDEPGSVRRLLFIDWPMEDRHRRRLAERWQRYLDVSDPERPRSIDGAALRDALRALVRRPFRTRPTFLAQPWGGTWTAEVLGVPMTGPKGGLGYELITPESGILLEDRGEALEVSFEVLLALEPSALLGEEVHRRFGASFPIRFDYLDTVGGGDLSIHCHPRERYMRDVFGLPYTQHESYYVVATRPGAVVFLGLREGVDVADFREAALRSLTAEEPLAIERFVNAFPATVGQLFLIPAGTPHASGEGNVVLEISSTPYLYSLRFYDWLRADLDGELRPVQLEHAFANLDPQRRGLAVERELVQRPRTLRSGAGFTELVIGRHPDLFFAVHRVDVATDAPDDTAGRSHVLALVEGDALRIETGPAEHRLSYGETIIVPAAVGAYRLRAAMPSKVVKAFVV